MLFKNCFKIISIFLLSHYAIASVVESQCGGVTIQIKMLKGYEKFQRKFQMYYVKNGQTKKMFFKTDDYVYLNATCIKNKNNHEVLLFQEFCGGTGCPEDMYGIFDPLAEKMLITPDSAWLKGNYKQAEHLLGFPPPFLAEDEGNYFCCHVSQE